MYAKHQCREKSREGSIENGYLRCPWHGWDYCPLTGKPPGDLEVDDALETFPVEVKYETSFSL